jgi:hypothetical protein
MGPPRHPDHDVANDTGGGKDLELRAPVQDVDVTDA